MDQDQLHLGSASPAQGLSVLAELHAQGVFGRDSIPWEIPGGKRLLPSPGRGQQCWRARRVLGEVEGR